MAISPSVSQAKSYGSHGSTVHAPVLPPRLVLRIRQQASYYPPSADATRCAAATPGCRARGVSLDLGSVGATLELGDAAGRSLAVRDRGAKPTPSDRGREPGVSTDETSIRGALMRAPALADESRCASPRRVAASPAGFACRAAAMIDTWSDWFGRTARDYRCREPTGAMLPPCASATRRSRAPMVGASVVNPGLAEKSARWLLRIDRGGRGRDARDARSPRRFAEPVRECRACDGSGERALIGAVLAARTLTDDPGSKSLRGALCPSTCRIAPLSMIAIALGPASCDTSPRCCTHLPRVRAGVHQPPTRSRRDHRVERPRE